VYSYTSINSIEYDLEARFEFSHNLLDRGKSSKPLCQLTMGCGIGNPIEYDVEARFEFSRNLLDRGKSSKPLCQLTIGCGTGSKCTRYRKMKLLE
jgi:hypothetical protein